MVTPFRYCAENGSTKTLKPPPGSTRSSSAARSSMTRLYLKPLQPPGCTLTRRPPSSTVTPSASMNFLTSTPAFGVRVRSISGCDETDIYPPVLHEFRLLLARLVVSQYAPPGTTAQSRRTLLLRPPASPTPRGYRPESAYRFRTTMNTLPRYPRSSWSTPALRQGSPPDRTHPAGKPRPSQAHQALPGGKSSVRLPPAPGRWRR